MEHMAMMIISLVDFFATFNFAVSSDVKMHPSLKLLNFFYLNKIQMLYWLVFQMAQDSLVKILIFHCYKSHLDNHN